MCDERTRKVHWEGLGMQVNLWPHEQAATLTRPRITRKGNHHVGRAQTTVSRSSHAVSFFKSSCRWRHMELLDSNPGWLLRHLKTLHLQCTFFIILCGVCIFSRKPFQTAS
ncbi:hypothetical protein IF1G_11359 [Cordyceps javanica]|uniref:Uncharacterized protein n=1 Tax=Cordyceps javanica TaxID=43265 RepID=A0A545UKJ4_9HYPO|nr:hypothetical protein IF1G_11359 [Cordyceps javanica]